MKKIVIGNLKMNLLNAVERERYLKWLDKELAGKRFSETEIVICPPFVHLEAFQKWGKKKVRLGAQNMFSEPKGSYTGEVSPVMLKNFGCEYVVLGHSERRRFFSENNREINAKIQSALKHGLKPVICVGESQTEKDRQQTLTVIDWQLKEVLAKVPKTKADQLVIAYEPIWAVGTDVVPSTNEVMESRLLIKKILVQIYGAKHADKIPVLYGGSVNARTVNQVCNEAGMHGVLVGRESLIPYEFIKIADIIKNYKQK